MPRSSPFLERRPWQLDLVVVGVPLAVLYAVTGSRDLGTIDSGELATVCARLGIAHPTGYPLYTLLGRLAALVHPGSPIEAVNALSAVAAWAAALLTATVMRLITEITAVRAASGWARWGAPWAAGLWFGVDRELWRQGAGNEVYSLHLFAVVGLVGLLVAIWTARAGGRTLLGLGYLTGLAFAHHLSTAFLVPALAVGVLFWAWDARGSAHALRWVLLAIALALLAWSVNLYLPIRSAREPVLDWGDPVTWSRFWRHYLAAQYRVWQFESAADFGVNSREYLLSLPARVTWPVLVLAVAGAWSIRRHARLAIGFLLVAVTTFLWASGYSIHDLAPYYLPADLIVVLLAGVALANIAERLGHRFASRAVHTAIALALAAITTLSAAVRWEELDRSGDRFVRIHATMVLASLPPNTILLSAFWDAVVSPSLYLQEIEALRPDVTVVDPELLRRSWYFPQLRRRDPGLLAPIEPLVETFLADLALFEDGRPYDSARIEQSYRAVIRGIALPPGGSRPVRFTPDVDPSFAPPGSAVPGGLVFAVSDRDHEGPSRPPDLEALLAGGFRPTDKIHLLVLSQWRTMAENRARYLEHFGRPSEAEPWRALVREIDLRAPGAATAGPRG